MFLIIGISALGQIISFSLNWYADLPSDHQNGQGFPQTPSGNNEKQTPEVLF